MSFLSSLANIFDQRHPQQPQRRQQQPSSPPDITYNPNPNTNIPYSSHDLNAVRLMPGHTGIPRGQANVGQMPNMSAMPPSPQGGAFNPGYIPLQSGFMGGVHNIQPTRLNDQSFDPQNIYFY